MTHSAYKMQCRRRWYKTLQFIGNNDFNSSSSSTTIRVNVSFISITIHGIHTHTLHPCSIKSTFYHPCEIEHSLLFTQFCCWYLFFFFAFLFCCYLLLHQQQQQQQREKAFFTHFIAEHWIYAEQCFNMMWTKVNLQNEEKDKKFVHCVERIVRLLLSQINSEERIPKAKLGNKKKFR